MKYIKSYWEESRGDEYDSWGGCNYYFEFGDDLFPVREIQIYDNGYSLIYEEGEKNEDIYGMLTNQPLNLDEISYEEISFSEFYKEWNTSGNIEGDKQW